MAAPEGRISLVNETAPLKVGAAAPDFELPSHLGGSVTLSQLRGKNVVIAFYPAAWTTV